MPIGLGSTAGKFHLAAFLSISDFIMGSLSIGKVCILSPDGSERSQAHGFGTPESVSPMVGFLGAVFDFLEGMPPGSELKIGFGSAWLPPGRNGESGIVIMGSESGSELKF